MTTPRGFRDRADDGLLTLLGEIPELIRNLVIAEVDAGKAWLSRTAKDAKWGALWLGIALFVLFWTVPVFLAFLIILLSVWWYPWVSALVVLVFGVLLVAVFGLLGVLRFRKVVKRQNPAQSIAQDVKEVRGEF